MGRTKSKVDGVGEPIEAIGTGTGKNSGNPGTTDTATATGAGTGGRTDTATGEDKIEASKNDGLLVISESDEVPKPPAPKKAKPKKKKQTKKNNDVVFNAEQIKTFIMTFSTIIATRPGFEMFALSDSEAEQLSIPIANILAKTESLSAMGEHADSITLLITAGMIFIPRIIIFIDMKKEQKKLKGVQVNGKQLNIDDCGKERKSEKTSRPNHENTNTTGKTNGSDVLSSIPSLA